MDEESLKKSYEIMDEKKQAAAFYKHLHLATLDMEPAQILTADEVRNFIAHEYNRFTKS